MKKFFIKLIPIGRIKHRLLNKYFPLENKRPEFKITKNTRCLMVCPHADDEVIGAGGVLLKYANNFDCICVGSSGVAYNGVSAKERSEIRKAEFNNVMDVVGIKRRWIFTTFGQPPMCDQIKSNFDKYCAVLDTDIYDYIFLPNPKDNHPEHKYITNKLFKSILKKKGYKPGAVIVFYEVWTPISEPNYFEDISDVADKKFEIVGLYASQNIYINYPERVQGLNKYRGMLAANVPYAEAFELCPISEYLKSRKNR